MKAGRELDVLIAEKVMGRVLVTFDIYPQVDQKPRPYSTDIAAAFEVVATLQKRGWKLKLWQEAELWLARFFTPHEFGWHYNGESAPHAICLAALKALER